MSIIKNRATSSISWFARLANLLAAFGTFWVFILMGAVVADIAGRNFLNTPFTGVAEFAGLSVAAIVFLQLGAGIFGGRMTRSAFLIDRLGRHFPRLRLALDVLYALVGCVIFALLAYIAWPELVDSWRRNEFYGVRGIYMIPGWPFRALAVIGAVMGSLAHLFLIPGLLRDEASDVVRIS